jgi:hypothetical protein
MKIFSMSVFGEDNRYIVGAKRQIELAEKYYPEWNIRLYVDNANNFKDVQHRVDLIEVPDGSWGPFWRFQPLFEDDNNIVIVRDSDDRITIREFLAVKEWLKSNKSFHMIKDHQAHFDFPIMAGLFGFKGKFNSELKDIMIKFQNEHKYYLSDQFFLRDFILPQIQNDYLLHNLNEGWFKETKDKLVNRYCFCGNGYDEHDNPIYPDFLPSEIDYSQNVKFNEGILTE